VANPAGDALTAAEITAALKDIAASTKKRWVTIECKHCDRQGKYEVDVPDDSTRLNAIEFMVEHGYGKPGTSKDETKVDLDVDITTLTPEARVTLRKQLVTITGITHKQDGTLLLNRSAPRTRPESPPIP
jgi:hypothetical protein